MKISIVGCGGISRTHNGAVRDIPYARIISVADCIPERAEAAASTRFCASSPRGDPNKPQSAAPV